MPAFLILAFVFLAFSMLPAASQGRVLPGAEAQRVLAGSQASFKCSDGTIGRARYNADGSGTANFRFPEQPDHVPDQTGFGRVRAEGDRVCISWRQLAASGENCFILRKLARNRYRGTTLDGQGWCEFTLR